MIATFASATRYCGTAGTGGLEMVADCVKVLSTAYAMLFFSYCMTLG